MVDLAEATTTWTSIVKGNDDTEIETEELNPRVIVTTAASVHMKAAQVALQNDDASTALQRLRRARVLVPKDMSIVKLMAEAHIKLSDYSTASTCLTFIINASHAVKTGSVNNTAIPVDADLTEFAVSRLSDVLLFDAEAMFDHDQLSNALDRYSQSARLKPDSKYAGLRYRRMVQCLIRLDRWSHALAAIDLAIGKVDNVAVTSANASIGKHTQFPKLIEAEALGNKFMLATEQVVELYLLRARLRIDHKSIPAALSDIASATVIDPKNVAAQHLFKEIQRNVESEFELAQQAFHSKQFDLVLGRLRPLLLIEPDNPEFLLLAGKYYVVTGEPRRASSRLLKGLSNVTSKTNGVDNNSSELAQDIQQYLGLALLKVAEECRKNENKEDEIALVTEAIAVDPTVPEPFIARGDCYFEDGLMVYALADFRSALELLTDSTDSNIKHNLTVRCASALTAMAVEADSLQHHGKAVDYLTEALCYTPRCAEIFACRGWSHVRASPSNGVHETDARNDAIEAIKIEPDHTSALALLSYLDRDSQSRQSLSPTFRGNGLILPPISPQVTSFRRK